MKGSTREYGMVRDGNGSRTSRPIIGRMSAFSSRTTSRSLVSICVVMVFCTFRSSLILVVATCRLLRSPAGAAARIVAEGLVLGKPTAAQRRSHLAHAPGRNVDPQVTAQVHRSVGHKLYQRRLLWLLRITLLKPVVKRPTRTATHYLGHLLRRGVLGLDPRPLLHIEYLRQATDTLGEVQAPSPVVVDRHAGGGVCPRLGDRQFFFFTI